MTCKPSLELIKEDHMRKMIAERKAKYQQLTGVEKLMIERDKAEAKATEDKILPSRFQIGDEVIIKAKVKGVQFVDGKVSYCFWLDDKLHTITSDHVEPANEDAIWLEKADDARADGYASQERVDAFLADFSDDKDAQESALDYSYDKRNDVLAINGINYSGEVFRQLGGLLPAGEIFKLVKRSDGILTIFKWD